jgi:hypothetical protein
MSEANVPSPDQSQNQKPSKSDWDNPTSAEDQANSAGGTVDTQAEDWQDWQTVDFPNAISVDAIERQTLYASDDVPTLDWLSQATPNSAAASLWSTGTDNTEPPEIADLIALIQELNQCNDVLLDRVSQLEESLERSQQVKATETCEKLPADATYGAQLVAAQAEITQLSNDLEFAQQTTQRQQILIETLTGQLESSQERVAQMERECALTQQRYSEQSHQLVQAESASRDLRTRLQRQQRYTLQFKAALEKCLEVPPPSYEAKQAEAEAIATPHTESSQFTPQSFLPKAKRIQPWSAQPQFLSEFDADNPLEHLNLENFNLDDEAQLTPQAQPDTAQKQEANRQFRPASPASLDLSAIVAPIGSAQTEAESTHAPVDSTQASPQRSVLSYDLKKAAGWWSEAIAQQQPDPEQSALQPNQSESEPSGSSLPPSAAESVQPQPFTNELTSSAAPEKPAIESATPQTGEAEDTLWQDLARLIDVSTDDVVKASGSNDFDSFKATIAQTSQSAPLQSNSLDDTPLQKPQQQPLTLKQQIDQGLSIAQLLLSPTRSESADHPPALAQPAASQPTAKKDDNQEQNIPGAFTANSNWPSPIVYPLRTPKKIESLAAVKLPTFPR